MVFTSFDEICSKYGGSIKQYQKYKKEIVKIFNNKKKYKS
jgi:hypothetical protein